MVNDASPLVVLASGVVHTLLSINESGYNKSIERKQIWHIHKSGRLLPYDTEHRVDTIKQCDGWYEAVITLHSQGASKQNESPVHEYTSSKIDTHNTNKSLGNNDILAHLTALIAERRNTMPDGSYTTYLFSQGPNKIRKKLAEEAVELVLAKDTEHIRSETADLLYNLLVFLESESITLHSVLQTLEKRA